MKYLYIICFILLCCTACKKQNNQKIEIYLTKNYIEPYEGILFKNTKTYNELDSTYREWYKDERVDTINRKIIYGGSFKATATDISKDPFIRDSEIKGFNVTEDLLLLDTIVNKRINKLHPSTRYVQFVLTVDKIPVLTGYFWNPMSSRLSTTYSIFPNPEYIYNRKKIEGNKIGYTLEYGNPKFMNIKSKRPPYNQKLIKALRISNRLIK